MSWRERFQELNREFGFAFAVNRLIKKILRPLISIEALILLERDLTPELSEPELPAGHKALPISPNDLDRILHDLEL